MDTFYILTDDGVTAFTPWNLTALTNVAKLAEMRGNAVVNDNGNIVFIETTTDPGRQS